MPPTPDATNPKSSSPNADQIDYWNGEAGARWVTFQERIDGVFVPLTAAALDHASPQVGEAALDIGCGCGATALELARRVGAGGSVAGIDVSKPMLERAAERARAAQLTNVKLVLADAATYSFPEGPFDVAFSRFGVMFFDDPVCAFANIRSSLRPGARLMFVSWRSLAENPWFLVPLAAAQPHLPLQPEADPEAPGPLAFADPNRVRRILEEAGFTGVEFHRHDTMMKLGGPNDLEAALDFVMRVGPLARALADADARATAAATVAIRDALREHETAEGVALRAGVWFVSGGSA